MIVKKFILKDVRCFEGTQEFNIRPLTFLVGENSTGKSTILGCMQALGNLEFNSGKGSFFDFNTDPYQMGAYADIARKTGGRGGGRRQSFDLGFEIQGRAKKTIHFLATLVERESGSEPIIQRIKIEINDVVLVVEVTTQEKGSAPESPFSDIYGPTKSALDSGKPVFTFTVDSEEGLFYILRYFTFHKIRRSEKKNKDENELMNILTRFLSRLTEQPLHSGFHDFHSLFPPYTDLRFESFAPIRSKPMRTYDPVRELEDPEGGGMPMTLMNMYRSDKAKWEDMQQRLVKFGKASGLFTDIEVKKHGRSVNDPFQLQVKVKGPKTNIIDVGYGVSQILPILVRIVKARRETHFLVQQPEVHLHPKGQAELVSFLLDRNDRLKHKFIVETHSDAMINRARIEIMKEKVKPEDVSLIYLEPVGNKVDVHNISFDAEANMIGVPPSYRKFFLKEDGDLLGI